MKVLYFTLLLSLISYANTQRKVENTTLLRSYNHTPSAKFKKQRTLRSLAKIKRQEAYTLAVSLCDQNVLSSKLTHRGQLLFYRIYTDDYKVEINALDGAIISKVLL